MPHRKQPIPERDRRLRAAKLLVSMAKEISVDVFGDDQNWGSKIDNIIIACAVSVGEVEGRPMTAHKLALYLGMPRTTVVRKLRELLAAGVVVR